MLKVELKRAFFNRYFTVAVVIGLVALGQGLYSYGRGFPLNSEALSRGVDPFTYNTFDALLSARLGLMSLVVPLIAALPFADSIAIDRSSGYIRPVLIRSQRHRYVGAKFIANALAGGIVVVLPHLVSYAVASAIFPEGLMDYETFRQQRMIVTGPLSEFYKTDPSLYIWFVILLSFLFGIVYASIGMFVALFTDNRYIALASPFIFYMVASFAIASIGGFEGWMPTATFTPQQVTTTTFVSIFVQFGMLFALCGIGVLVYSRQGLRNV